MKKLLSMALVVAMVMSLFCVVPASAAVEAKKVGEAVGTTTRIELEDYADDVEDPFSIGFDAKPSPKDKAECSEGQYLDFDSKDSSDASNQYMSLKITLDAAKAGFYEFKICGHYTYSGDPQLYVDGEALTRTRSSKSSDVWSSNTRYHTYTGGSLGKGINIVEIRFNKCVGEQFVFRGDYILVTLTEEIDDLPVVGDSATIEMEEYADAVTGSGISIGTPKAQDGTGCSGGKLLFIETVKKTSLTAGMYSNIAVPVNVTEAGYYDLELVTSTNTTSAEESIVDICVNSSTPLVKFTNSDAINHGLYSYKFSAYLDAGINNINIRFRAWKSGNNYFCNAYVDALNFTKIGDSNYATPASNTAKVSFTKAHTGKVIVALYGENNKFVGWGTADVENNHTATVELTHTGAAVSSAKAFIWDGLTTVKPLAAHINLTVK